MRGARAPGVVLAALLLAAGGGPGFGAGVTTGSAVDRITDSATRSVPTPPPPAATPSPAPLQWVPDRLVPVPGRSEPVRVPGHWERPLPDGRVHTPPVPLLDLREGPVGTAPSGVREPADIRRGE